MIEKLIFEFQSLTSTLFWLVICLACAAGYFTREMTGRSAYALASLPVFTVAGFIGACVVRVAEVDIGVDRVTDTIAGAVAGMMVLVICLMVAQKAATVDKK